MSDYNTVKPKKTGLGLSVIIPVYNRSDSIRLSIQSVLNDLVEFSEFEIIVVDDCSTDQTVLQVQDLPITLLTLERNMGANFARNTGIENANYPWIAFHDSDDIWLPGKTERFHLYMNNSDFIFSSIIQYQSGNSGIFPYLNYALTSFSVEYFKERILERNYVSTQALFVKKSFLYKIGGFDNEMPRFQDWEMAIRMLYQGSGVFIPFPFSLAILQSDSISKNYLAGIKARKLIAQKHKTLFKQNLKSHILFTIDLMIRILFLPIKS